MFEMQEALLVLDIQKDYDGETVKYSLHQQEIDWIIQRINKISKKARSIGLPVIYLGKEFEKKLVSNIFHKLIGVKTTDGARLDPRLSVVSDLYFPKNRRDALTNIELRKFLQKHNVNHLNIVGLFAEGCVYKTALSAIKHHFTVTVIKDAVCASSETKKIKALQRMEEKGVELLGTKDILNRLL